MGLRQELVIYLWTSLLTWPLFGSVHQLLAGLALLVTTICLARRKVSIAYTCIPIVFIIFMTGWAMVLNIQKFYNSSNWLLFFIGLAVFVLEIWMIIESVVFQVWCGKRWQML